MSQQDLFSAEAPSALPPGLRYEPNLIDADESKKLTAQIAELPFRAFEFHGYTGKRRVVSFGWKYDFSSQRVEKIQEVPEFLRPLRHLAAAFAGLEAGSLEHALVTEYQPAAAIGWHRDKAVFDQVIGVSFGASCRMRFRRRIGAKWERRSIALEPGSGYLLSGEARRDWEHSIPPVTKLRYSVTFRSMRR